MNENEFDKNGKIPKIEKAFNTQLEKDIAYMMATSHEYKKPNTDAAIKLVKNYKWEKTKEDIKNLQGINKPVDSKRVEDMVKNMRDVKPFIVVDKFHGIRPQSHGKKILLDGHHRKETCERKQINIVPVYKGKYTGKAEKKVDELIQDKKAGEIIDTLIELTGGFK